MLQAIDAQKTNDFYDFFASFLRFLRFTAEIFLSRKNFFAKQKKTRKLIEKDSVAFIQAQKTKQGLNVHKTLTSQKKEQNSLKIGIIKNRFKKHHFFHFRIFIFSLPH